MACVISPVIGLRWGMPGKATTTTGPPLSMRGYASCDAAYRADCSNLPSPLKSIGRVEVAGLEEERAVQAAVGIVGGIGRRRAGIALGGQHRVGIGQAAVGQRAGQRAGSRRSRAGRRRRCRSGRR